MIIELDDLIIRPFRESDVDDLYELQNDEQVTKYLSYDSWSHDRCVENLKEWIMKYRSNGNPKVVAVVKKNSGNVIGLVGWIFSNDNKDAELAIRISSKEWGQGYGTNLICTIRDYAFNKFKVDSVLGITHNQNTGMRQVFKRNGFSEEIMKTDSKAFFYELKREDYLKF